MIPNDLNFRACQHPLAKTRSLLATQTESLLTIRITRSDALWLLFSKMKADKGHLILKLWYRSNAQCIETCVNHWNRKPNDRPKRSMTGENSKPDCIYQLISNQFGWYLKIEQMCPVKNHFFQDLPK